MKRRYRMCVGFGSLGLSLAIAAVLAGCNGATLTVVQNDDGGGGGGHTPGGDSGVKTNGEDGGHSPIGPTGDDDGGPGPGDDGGPPGLGDDAGPVDGDGGGGSGLCIPDGGITFTMNVDSDASSVCFMGTESPGSCDGWFGISDFSQTPLDVIGECFSGCPEGPAGAPKPASFTWDGTVYQDNDTTFQCPATCAAPGQYYATMCVQLPLAGAQFCDNGPTTCKQVAFTWPPEDGGTEVVVTVTP